MVISELKVLFLFFSNTRLSVVRVALLNIKFYIYFIVLWWKQPQEGSLRSGAYMGHFTIYLFCNKAYCSVLSESSFKLVPEVNCCSGVTLNIAVPYYCHCRENVASVWRLFNRSEQEGNVSTQVNLFFSLCPFPEQHFVQHLHSWPCKFITLAKFIYRDTTTQGTCATCWESWSDWVKMSMSGSFWGELSITQTLNRGSRERRSPLSSPVSPCRPSTPEEVLRCLHRAWWTLSDVTSCSTELCFFAAVCLVSPDLVFFCFCFVFSPPNLCFF